VDSLVRDHYQICQVRQVLGERVRAARESKLRANGRKGWSQAMLARRIAKLIDVPGGEPQSIGSLRVMVTRIEQGNRPVSVEELFLLAAALGVSPTWLLAIDPTADEVEIAPRLCLPGALAWAWMDGIGPLRPEDVDAYEAARPPRPDVLFEENQEVWDAVEQYVKDRTARRRHLWPDEKAALLAFLTPARLTLEHQLDFPWQDYKGSSAIRAEVEAKLARVHAVEQLVESLPTRQPGRARAAASPSAPARPRKKRERRPDA
jgi:transcriptional regulator with XRE-family HTH domain